MFLKFTCPDSLVDGPLCSGNNGNVIIQLPNYFFCWSVLYVFFCNPLAKKTMWERLTAPEDVFSKLQRENIAIIESYGAALMEVVCRDACDGHEIGRVW